MSKHHSIRIFQISIQEYPANYVIRKFETSYNLIDESFVEVESLL